ncbi:MAG TPA: hypothetical protein VF840_01290 [Terriglobales bacterium]
MGKINWGRVVLCGIVAGLTWTVLSSLITAFFARDFVAAVPGGRLSSPSGGLVAFLFTVNLVMGIWAMWHYAAIRPRYGPGPKTAVATGFSWWIISSLIDATWGSFGFVVPKAVLAPMAASLPAIIIAALVGAYFYRE